MVLFDFYFFSPGSGRKHPKRHRSAADQEHDSVTDNEEEKRKIEKKKEKQTPSRFVQTFYHRLQSAKCSPADCHQSAVKGREVVVAVARGVA